MKGKLIKIEERWMVGTVCYADLWSNYMPLHPDDVKQIEEDAKVFDNIEARIAAYPEVEFEVVNDNFRYYAKLIPSKEQQKQLITEIMNEDAKDGLYEDDVEIPMKNKTIDYSYGFKDGYTKAKEKYKYDYSQECKCDIRGGETWCCNVCGLPCKTSETLYTEEQVREAFLDGQMDGMMGVMNNCPVSNVEIYIQSLKQNKKL